jgi:hypothetical protein
MDYRLRVPRFLVAACIVPFVGIGGPGGASAAEMVVVESQAAAYRVGQVLDAAVEIILSADERLAVATENGEFLSLEGPHRGPAAGAPAETSGTWRALARLIGIEAPEVGGLAGVRGVEAENAAADTRPSAWLIHAEQGGDQCVVRDRVVELWREAPLASAALELVDIAAERSVQMRWEAAEQRAEWPLASPPTHGGIYLLRPADGLRSLSIRIHTLPPSSSNTALAAVAWLAARGCIGQARKVLAEDAA